MNFLEGEAGQVEGRTGVRTTDAFVQLPPVVWAALQAAGTPRVFLGVRPEHLVPTEAQDGGFAAHFDGQVDLIESLGNEQHVTVALPHATLVVRLPADVRLQIGSSLRLAVAPHHLHLFDAETERRID